jgi:hypothetical protein
LLKSSWVINVSALFSGADSGFLSLDSGFPRPISFVEPSGPNTHDIVPCDSMSLGCLFIGRLPGDREMGISSSHLMMYTQRHHTQSTIGQAEWSS